jgi:hypothetical protein
MRGGSAAAANFRKAQQQQQRQRLGPLGSSSSRGVKTNGKEEDGSESSMDAKFGQQPGRHQQKLT